MVVLVAVPLGAFGLYLSLGEPTLRDVPHAGRTQAGGSQHASQSQPADTRAAQMEVLVNQAKTALDKNPEDTRSWSMLGQIYQMQGQLPEAIEAFENLAKYSDNHPEALIALAETHFMHDGETVSEVARDLFAQAKIQAPANPITYYYLALYHQGKGNFQGAMNEYAGLLSVSPSNAEWVADIEARMQAVAAEGSIEVPVVEMLAAIEEAAPAVGPSAEQVQQAQDMAPDDQSAMIRSMVERLAGKLKDNPDDLAGWKRLAQAYSVLGDKDGLGEAQAQIKRLEGK
ncbi:tetratricopeptide repeat protein [Pseudomonadota bacterium]